MTCDGWTKKKEISLANFLIDNSGKNIFLKSIETNAITGIKQMFELLDTWYKKLDMTT